jgi:hypothetical protein
VPRFSCNVFARNAESSAQNCSVEAMAEEQCSFDAASVSSTSGVVDRTVLPVRLAIVRFYAAGAVQDGSRHVARWAGLS